MSPGKLQGVRVTATSLCVCTLCVYAGCVCDCVHALSVSAVCVCMLCMYNMCVRVFLVVCIISLLLVSLAAEGGKLTSKVPVCEP